MKWRHTLFEPIVRPAVIAHRKEQHRLGDIAWEAKYKHLGQRLHISDLGGCPRAAYLRLLGHEPRPWDDYTIEVMQAGNVWEHENGEALSRYYHEHIGNHGLITQTVLGDGIWAGSDDYELANLNGVNYVIEHKNTSNANFQYGNRLPYNFHIYQVLGYAYLLHQTKPIQDWQARLYYHGRGNWAEFEVYESAPFVDGSAHILYEGQINGKPVHGELPTSLYLEMEKLERYWPDTLPPTYDTSVDFDITFGCTKSRGRKGHKVHYPSCRWWVHCHDLPYDQPVEL